MLVRFRFRPPARTAACLVAALALSSVQAGAQAGADRWLLVELEAPPTARVYHAAARAEALTGRHEAGAAAQRQAAVAAQQALAAIEHAQQAVVAALTGPAIGATVVFRTQRVVNGVAIRVAPGRDELILALPGVSALRPLEAVQPSTSTSVPFVGAAAAWRGLAGSTGDGISVGVIDSGIDYLHRDFGGSGASADSLANDPTSNDDGFFPTAKVVGGWDFVGDDYDGSGTPVPDPDPMDCMGHGTHVAGIVGGLGVSADGATYQGHYGPDTPFAELAIGPGVAPGVELYALRVFGCSGVTRVLVQAIEWAVDPNGDGDLADHLDVLNLSLGSRYGGADSSSAVAADNAALVGVVVVAAAGNGEDAYYVTDSPGVADSVISVAASRDDGLVFDALRLNSPPSLAGQVIASLAGADPGDPGVSGDVVRAQPAQACASLDNAALVHGRVALVDDGGCAATTKAAVVEAAGAVAMVVVAGGPWLPSAPDGDFSGNAIPMAAILRADGERIAQALPGVNLTLSSALTATRPELADTLAYFSARGPRRGDSHLKPDLSAPGDRVSSAAHGTGAGAQLRSGTSMATPHVAGAAALLRQARPGWSVEELKAALMNSAAHDLTRGPEAPPCRLGPSRAGAGRLDLAAALASEVVAFAATPPGAVGLSFGLVEVADRVELERQLEVVNRGSSAAAFLVAYDAVVDAPGVAVDFPLGAVVEVAAGQTVAVAVRLTATASLMRDTADPCRLSDPTFSGLARHWLSEEAGLVTLTPQAGAAPALRVPLHAAVRPVSTMTAAPDAVVLSQPSGRFELALSGSGLDSGSSPPGIQSRLSALEIVTVSPRSAAIADGAADLDVVAVASDHAARVAAGAGLADTVVTFAVVTHQAWSSPNQVAVNLWVDADDDGADDVLVFAAPIRTPSGAESDSVVVWVTDLATFAGGWQFYLNGFPPPVVHVGAFATNALLLPVNASALGLVAGSSRFTARVQTYARDGSTWYEADLSERFTYDPAHPGLQLSGEELAPYLWPDLDGQSVPVDYDAAGVAAAGLHGVVLVHHTNARDARVERVELLMGRQRRGGERVTPDPLP